jgi:hypothetical protein
VAARQGLQAKSFDKAAESYSDATGGSMSGDSLRRITEGFGQALEDKRSQKPSHHERPEPGIKCALEAKPPKSSGKDRKISQAIKRKAGVLS